MKLISLNIWGGRAFEPLMDYIEKSVESTDVFCFQEVFESPSGIVESNRTRTNVLQDLTNVLPGFHCLTAPTGSGYDNKGPVDFDITEMQATFIKKNSVPEIDSDGNIFLRGEMRRLGKDEKIGDIAYNFQYVRFRANGKSFAIANVHGIAQPGDKLDNKERLRQSEIIKNFLAGESGAKIVCGDFNLLPETQSIKTLKENMVDLIKKFGVERTRSRLSRFYGKEDFQTHADYAFVSPDVSVINFSVPDVDVSDHLPLVLEFS